MKPRRAPAILPQRKRGLICGCSHGLHADPSALGAVVKFRDEFKPDVVVHLGDFIDTTAFRSGAKGSSDEGADVDADITAGLNFLTRLRPTHVFNGNHEHRIWKHADDPNALVQKCARDSAKHLTEYIRDELKAVYVDHYDITRSWLMLGPFALGHGWMYGENAVRDHAEMMGNCAIAHTHSFDVSRGRRAGGATGIAVGMLARPESLTYALGRRATHKWTQSFLTVEYTDHDLQFQPHILKASVSQPFERIE